MIAFLYRFDTVAYTKTDKLLRLIGQADGAKVHLCIYIIYIYILLIY